MTTPSLSRRRFITLSAAMAGAGLLPARRSLAEEPLIWRGDALGADASLRLYGVDHTRGRRLIAECLAEVERLEQVFSLYRDDSSVSQLNRQGRLEAPPLDLVQLLSISRHVSVRSNGAFDVTVQPLWELYAAHFAKAEADPNGPPESDIGRIRRRVDWRGITVEADRIGFDRPGMAVTLNGIAQGFVTDKVAQILRRRGMGHVLVDMGEIRAIGDRPDASPWPVRLEGGGMVPLVDRAISTSSPDGTRFSPHCNHIFVPSTGYCTSFDGSVSVVAATATLADALSTAIAAGGRALAGPLAELPGVSRIIC